MDGFDGLPISDEFEQVDGEDFFVGRFRGGVVALPLSSGAEPSGSASADEQINADERILPIRLFSLRFIGGRVIHVAKGGL